MPTENYTSKFRVDVSDLKKGISEANQAIKKANAEFKNATAGMKDWEKSADGLNAKITEQRKLVEEEQKKLDLLKEQLARVNKAQEDGQKTIRDLNGKYDEAVKKYGATSDEAKKYAKQLSDAQKAQERNKKSAEDLELQIINQDTAIKNARAQVNEYETALNKLENEEGEGAKSADKMNDELEDTGKQAQKSADGGIQAFAVALGNLAEKVIVDVTRKLGDLMKSVVDGGIAFDSSMSNVKAISGATSEQMQQLSDTAQELGKTTKFTSTEVADGFGYMAMAGWKTEDMLGGISGVLNLAAASGADLATTSDIVTDSLTAFGQTAEEAGRLADIMAATAANANTNVELMGETFKYVAPLSGALGFTMEDTAIATGLMANSGIKATQAGTSMRALFTRLAAPTKDSAEAMNALGLSLTDSEGNMKSLYEIMSELRGSFGELKISEEEFTASMNKLDTALESGEMEENEYNEAQAELIEKAYGAEGALKAQYASMLAGKNGLSGFLAIVNASDEDFQKLTDSIYDSSGAAQEMADTMIDNLGGDLTLLSSAFDGFKQKIYESVSGPLRSVVQGLTNEILPALTDLIEGKEGAAERLGEGIGKIATNIVTTLTGFIPQAVTIGTKLIDSVVTGLIAALPDVVNGIKQGITSLLRALGTLLPNIIDAVLDVLPALNEALYGAIPQILSALTDLLTILVNKMPPIVQKALATAPKVWKAVADSLTAGLPALIAGFRGLLQAIIDQYPVMIPILKEGLTTLINETSSLISTFSPLLQDALIQFVTVALEAMPEIITLFSDEVDVLIPAIVEALIANIPLLVQTAVKMSQATTKAVPPIIEALWETVKAIFKAGFDNLKDRAFDAWEGIKTVFSKVADFFGDTFSGAWERVKAVFSTGGKIFDGIKEGIVSAFTATVNAIIRGINKVVTVPFESINDILDKIQGIEVLGISPFEGLVSRINIPQIPELAYGGILKRGQLGLLEGKNDEAVIPLQNNIEGMRRIAGMLAEEMGGGVGGAPVNNYTFTQTNNSPKALSRWDIYRQTKNLINAMKGV